MNGSGAFSEGVSPGRCSVGEQRRPGRHPATARMNWSKEAKTVVTVVISKRKETIWKNLKRNTISGGRG